MKPSYDPKRGAGPLVGLPTHVEKAAYARVTAQRINAITPVVPPSLQKRQRKHPPYKILRHGRRCHRINKSYVSGALTLLNVITKDGWKALRILRSGRVPLEVETYRNAICHACPSASKVEIKRKVLHFCKCCSCGIWTSTEDGAEIEAKNTHAKNMCPEDPPRFGEYAGEPITKKRSIIKLIPSLIRAASSMIKHTGIAMRRDRQKQ